MRIFLKKLVAASLVLFVWIPSRAQYSPTVKSQFITLIQANQYDQIKALLFSNECINNDQVAYWASFVAQQSNNEDLKCLGLYAIGKSYYNAGKHEVARRQLLDLLVHVSHQKTIAHYQQLKRSILSTLFFLELREGNCQQGLAYINQYAADIPSSQFNLIFGVARIELGECRAGIDILRDELFALLKEKRHNPKTFADYANNIGDGFIKLYDNTKQQINLDSAIIYYQRAFSYMKQNAQQSDHSAALLQLRLARILFHKNEYDSSIKLYAGAEARFHFNQASTLQAIYRGKADCFTALNKCDEAIGWCNQFLKSYADNPGSKEHLLHVYYLMASNFEKINKIKEANQFIHLFAAVADDINVKKLRASDMLYAIDIAAMKTNLEIQLNNRKFNHWGWILALLGGLLPMLLGGTWYFVKRRKAASVKVEMANSPVQSSEAEPKIELPPVFVPAITTEHATTAPAESPAPVLPVEEVLSLPAEVTETPEPLPNHSTEIPVSNELAAAYIQKIAKGLSRIEDRKEFLESDFSLAKLSRKLKTNTSYLSQYFNQYKQMGFTEYLNHQRIQYALEQMAHNPVFKSYTTQAIATEIGYKNAATFVNAFKKITGTTPAAYLESC